MSGNTGLKTAPSVNDQVIEVNAVELADAPQDAAQAAPENGNENGNGENAKTEEFRIQGDELVTKVKALIHEGNIRRIIVKNETGHTLIEIPLTVGVVGGVLSAALFPVMAAVGAIGAVVAHLTLVIEKRE